MQFCSLERIWVREVTHLLSVLKIIFWNCLLTLYDNIGFQTPGTLKIWIAAGESWHSWQPFSGRTLRWVGEIPSKDKGQRERSSQPNVSHLMIHQLAVKILETWKVFHLFLVRLGFHSTTPGRIWHECMTWFRVKRIWTQQPWQKKWMHSTSDAYLDWFAGRRNWMGRWGSSNWWISCFGGIPCDSHLVAECSGVWLRPRTCSDLGPQKLLVICYSHFGRINLTRECAAVLWLGRSLLVKRCTCATFCSHHTMMLQMRITVLWCCMSKREADFDIGTVQCVRISQNWIKSYQQFNKTE